MKWKSKYIHISKCFALLFQHSPLANIKKIDCALLPPCRRTLEMKTRRAQYVTSIWTRASTANPSEGMIPVDYGWAVDASDNLLKPVWFEGSAIPDDIFLDRSHISDNYILNEDDTRAREEEMPNSEPSSDTENEAWSEESDSEFDE